MFTLTPADEFNLRDITSDWVQGQIKKLSNYPIPHYVPDIPTHMLSELYCFIEQYSSKTDFMQWHKLSNQLQADLDFLYQEIINTLQTAQYTPSWLSPNYSKSLLYLAISTHSALACTPDLYTLSHSFRLMQFRHDYFLTLNEK